MSRALEQEVTMNRIGAILGVCAMFAFSGAALAAEHPSEPVLGATQSDDCKEKSCSYTKNLGAYHSVEFKGQCDGYAPSSQTCHSGSGSVTCTATVTLTNYDSCSCTNWDFTNSHKAKVSINCPN